MSFSLSFWLKIVILTCFAALNAYLFYKSLGVNYQWELAREHIRFREEMPTLDEWINSPNGKLKTYLFNVTNAQAFLDGTDKRIKFQEVGPIVYRIRGYNDILSRNKTSLTYRKHRYRHIEFLPEDSVSPDILNKTIILPNLVLLGAAVKYYDWSQFIRPVFNAITISEKAFLKNSIYYFLWEFTTPGLRMLSTYIPNIASNCGVLFNALTEKEEVYNVRIGTENGMENFFRLTSLNNGPIFKEQYQRARYLKSESNVQCPIDVRGGWDNSLFPPFLKPDTELSIVATESCRTLPLRYQKSTEYDGFPVYRYTIAETSEVPTCLDSTYGIKLPKGMFDISACVINGAPSVFSSPHFHNSGYNWSEHFEGFSPDTEKHEPYILLEPVTGIPIMERYRFQSNIPMPSLKDFYSDVKKFDRMVIPTFWYEFEMDELPKLVKFLIRFNVFVTPVLQPLLMASFVVITFLCVLKIVFLFKGRTIWDTSLHLFGGTPNVKLETKFQDDVVPYLGSTVKIQ